MLPFPIKNHPIKIFTRATPGISLVMNKIAASPKRSLYTQEACQFFWSKCSNSVVEVGRKGRLKTTNLERYDETKAPKLGHFKASQARKSSCVVVKHPF